MYLYLCCCWFVALAQSTPEPRAAALHATVQSDFTFLSATRTTTAEFWGTGDRAYEKRGDQIRIDRHDLGRRWLIHAQKATYVEQPLPAEAPSPPGTSREDMYTAGFEYQPEFLWDLQDTAETQSIQGRSCRLSVATGVADFAETILHLWLCPSADARSERPVNDLVLRLAGFAYRDIPRFLASQLAGRPDTLLLLLEETTEPSIASVMTRKVRVAAIETAPPPPGIFELPQGFRKSAGE